MKGNWREHKLEFEGTGMGIRGNVNGNLREREWEF